MLGGWLLDNFWWGSVFLINVPVVVLALVAVRCCCPNRAARSGADRHRGHHPVQPRAGRVTYGFIKAGEDGWGDPAALGTILAGAAVLAVFVAWERWLTGRDGRRRTTRGGGSPADRAGAVPVGRLHLGHDPDHVRLVRDVRHPVRDAAVLPGGPRPGLAGHRAAAAADDRRHGDRHGRRHPAAVAAEGRRRPPARRWPASRAWSRRASW